MNPLSTFKFSSFIRFHADLKKKNRGKVGDLVFGVGWNIAEHTDLHNTVSPSAEAAVRNFQLRKIGCWAGYVLPQDEDLLCHNWHPKQSFIRSLFSQFLEQKWEFPTCLQSATEQQLPVTWPLSYQCPVRGGLFATAAQKHTENPNKNTNLKHLDGVHKS